MELTEPDEAYFEETCVCDICGYDMVKVRNHDHLTGRCRSPVHQSCNLNYQRVGEVQRRHERYPQHGREVHLLRTESVWSESEVPGHVLVHASNLDTLAKNLAKDQFQVTAKFFLLEILELLMKKVVYPYDYMEPWEKCEKPQLPPKEAFHSELNRKDIEDSVYEHAQKV